MDEVKEDLLSAESELPIDNEASAYLMGTAKWAKFVAIAFYVIIGLLLLFFLTQGQEILYAFRQVSMFSGSLTMVFSILGIIVLVITVTYYYLLNFANKIKAGIELQNIDVVNEGLRSLNVHLIIVAILSGMTIFLTLWTML